jgi:hypothetical protein
MPGMSGIEAAIIVRRELPTCKILLFSGQAATSDLLDKARADGHEFELLSSPCIRQTYLQGCGAKPRLYS